MKPSRPVTLIVAAVLGIALGFGIAKVAVSARGAGIERVAGGAFPISSAVTVPAGADLVYLAGTIARPSDPKAPRDDPATFGGDTEAQTAKALEQIRDTLAGLHLTLGDVVMMHVYLAGDPAKGGKMDFDGMMAAYRRYFGTPDQPSKPARSAMQVAALVAPGALVEIEVIAARPR